MGLESIAIHDPSLGKRVIKSELTVDTFGMDLELARGMGGEKAT